MSDFKKIPYTEYRKLSKDEKELYDFMLQDGMDECLKKKCSNCPTARNQKWIMRIGAGVITWLSYLTVRS